MTLFKERPTPSQVRKIAETIRRDPAVARVFAGEVIDRLVKLIPDDGLVPAERLEGAFLIAVDVCKIFKLSKLNIWDFFEKPKERSLLGHVFISAIDGRSLSDIMQQAQRHSDPKKDVGRFLFDATAFKESHQLRMILA